MSPVNRRLEQRVAAVRGHLIGRTRGVGAAWATAALALLGLIGWGLVGSEGWRQGSDVPLALVLGALLVLVVATMAVGRHVARRLDEVSISSTVEESAGIRQGLVRGALELTRDTPAGVSRALAESAVLGTARELEAHSDAELGGAIASRLRRRSRVGWAVSAGLIMLLGGLTVAVPGRTGRLLAGLGSPFATMVDPVLPPLVVIPGSVEVQRGTDVQVEVGAGGREVVELNYQAAGDVARSERLLVDGARATHTFRTVSTAIEYHITDAAGNRTPTYRIVPIDPLFVSDRRLTVSYPAHTGLPDDEFRGDPPPLRLPAGSTLRFEGEASRALSSVALVDSTGAGVLAFDIDERRFSARWSPRVSRVVAWDFRDRSGGAAEIRPEPLRITVIPDGAPIVRIPMPGRDTVMPLNLRQPLLIEAGDDYGLSRVELVAYRVTSFGERREPVAQGFDPGGQRAILARPLLDLRGWGLLPGDTVRYFARATDNSREGQVSISEEYALRMPEAAELRREAESAFGEAAERLEELAAAAERQATENREQALESATRGGEEAEQGGTSAEADFAAKEKLEAALADQRATSAAVDSLRSRMDALERMMEEAGQADPELRRQLEQLQEMLSEMTGQDLQQRMDELSQALERDDLEGANESLEEMAGQQEKLRERLEEALERVERAALEQDFRATTSEAQELAEQEQALADAMKEEDAPELRAQQQQDLADQTERLEERMASLEERLAEAEESEAADGVRDARERAAEARQQMERARQTAERGESGEAGEQAQEAAEQMDQAAKEMQEAMQQMAAEQMEAQQDALMRTADDALTLARRQAELQEEIRGSSRERLVGMRAEQASLLQGVRNMAANLQAASGAAMGANREISAQMGLAMESLQKTVESLGARPGTSPSATAEAERAVDDLNQLALMAIAGAEQMSQQGEGQGGEEVAERLEELAQEQGDLMNQSTQLMPMQLGEQAMSQQLEQMSQGQESVADDLGDLSQEPGSEESLGDLEELAREARLLAEQLQQGRLTPEMVQRQERLFHRLLDAGRSLEREEFSEERESEAPGVFERGDISALTGEQLGVMPYEVPDGEELRGLSPALRQLVLDYFERLNRTSGGGGS